MNDLILRLRQASKSCSFMNLPNNAATCSEAALELEKARDEIRQRDERIRDLESLAHDAEDIIGNLIDDEDPLDLADWRRWYRELGLLSAEINENSELRSKIHAASDSQRSEP